MNDIKYRTDGHLVIGCAYSNAKPVGLAWSVEDTKLNLCSGQTCIELSPSQLQQIAEAADTICKDLRP